MKLTKNFESDCSKYHIYSFKLNNKVIGWVLTFWHSGKKVYELNHPTKEDQIKSLREKYSCGFSETEDMEWIPCFDTFKDAARYYLAEIA